MAHQAAIETVLARRHLRSATLVLYDLTSTCLEGRHCPLARYGYSRGERRSNLKERQRGEDRIGATKTVESDSFVPLSPDLGREIAAWIRALPDRDNPRAFLFPNKVGKAFGVGNYLKRRLKPLAAEVGVHDVTLQALRRTSSTYRQSHATVKDMQRHLRHTDPQTTLKHHAKVIPESLRAAVAALDAQITGASTNPKIVTSPASVSPDAPSLADHSDVPS